MRRNLYQTRKILIRIKIVRKKTISELFILKFSQID